VIKEEGGSGSVADASGSFAEKGAGGCSSGSAAAARPAEVKTDAGSGIQVTMSLPVSSVMEQLGSVGAAPNAKGESG